MKFIQVWFMYLQVCKGRKPAIVTRYNLEDVVSING